MDILNSLLYIIPVLVGLLEYVAVSSAFAYARFAVEIEGETVSLLGGIIRVGGNLPYDAVPNMVVTLHLLALFLTVIYFVYFIVFSHSSDKRRQTVPPQEG